MDCCFLPTVKLCTGRADKVVFFGNPILHLLFPSVHTGHHGCDLKLAWHSQEDVDYKLIRFQNSLRSTLRSPSLVTHVRTYCDASSIHGVRYIAESSRPFFERFLWVVILVVSFILSGYYTVAVWEETPIAVVEIEGAHDNSRIPFPAVTICSNAKMSRAANAGKS
ncbi:unnamed protein product [Nezara viridula]|uniref:Uncharacterized protein n=1 Tax=Nezara viridula TaxID=85310 RepID=A0A9P0ECX8_NEZVI|nr:unnamed protein product [Nezara viridula]